MGLLENSLVLMTTRSGGAKAWRARQAEQRKFLEDYNEDPTPEPKSEEEEMDEGTERDFFAEYSIDSESGAEKEARGDQEVIEGSEDVSAINANRWPFVLS